ncbi:MAG: hypothetical protein DI551_00630 [Micavibrio aeruginosavorus]|uniref:Uncharacterized protein n=1 Tax=Micavibrio aeruginosavorus TaxID=349221 RepID=A0A2W5N9B2_9BACT|nr:MAG: hypothetical protein DI551_00630 [Micavibrio aeruginosavorus]
MRSINPSDICLNSQAAINRLTRRRRKRRASMRYWNEWNEKTATGTVRGDLLVGALIALPFVIALLV